MRFPGFAVAKEAALAWRIADLCPPLGRHIDAPTRPREKARTRRFTMKTISALLLLFATNPILVHAQTKQEPQRAPVVFTHVAVIDTAKSSVQQDMTVVISGDHVAEVGKAMNVKVPSSALVVDGGGKFLIPGLWDMHVHMFLNDPRSTNSWYVPLFIANGVTGVRDMWTTGDDFPQVVQWRRGLADGSFLGPRYGAVGWLVDGPEPIW